MIVRIFNYSLQNPACLNTATILKLRSKTTEGVSGFPLAHFVYPFTALMKSAKRP